MTCTSWRALVEEYLSVRRGLGFALEQPSYLLRDFARYADAIGHHGPLTTELAVRWAQASRSNDPAQAIRRLGAVRQFARYRALVDPATEVPPPGLLGRLPRRPQPHIYSDAELAALLEQASLLLPRRGLRPRTYVTFFSLLACTGLRLSEACQLAIKDVDWRGGSILLRERKTRHGAVVPLPRDAGRALVSYLREERPATDERRVFVQHRRASRGRRLSGNAVSAVVVRALERAGVQSPLAGGYVLRHTVASRLVRGGASLKEVADFLGHRSLDTTAIYAKVDVGALREVALPWPAEVTR